MTITPKFEIKQKVYLKTDPDKALHFVISYLVYSEDKVLYTVSGFDGTATHYDFELDDYENRVV